MNRPLKLGIAGLGTVGTGLLQLLARARRPARPQRRPRHRGRGRLGALAHQEAWRRSRGHRLVRRPGAARRRSLDRRLRRADRRRGRGRQGRGGGGAGGRQARRHRQQGAARQARHRARRAGREERRRPQLRGGGGRRHPHHQDAARGAGRQPDPARLRHPERHLQLHPDADAGGAPRLRRRAGGGAGEGLCRGRSHLRHRRLRHRAQAHPADEPGVRHARRARPDPRGGHRDDQRRPTSRRPTTSATASSCSAWR